MFEGKELRQIAAEDIRRLIESQIGEHLQLEYKSELYGTNESGRLEFLRDVCMFANAAGGVLLLGITEQRDGEGQPMGLPEPGQEFGLVVENPEALLLSYDSAILSCIDERLMIEAFAIPAEGARFVIALRVPDSINKPHSVRYKGRVYFPSRRERHRYEMDVREIKESAVRLATQAERAEAIVEQAISHEQSTCDQSRPMLLVGLMPVFFRNFMVDVKDSTLRQAFGNFDVRTQHGNFILPIFAYEGVVRKSGPSVVTLHRNGLITAQIEIRTMPNHGQEVYPFYPSAIDVLLRGFMQRAQILASTAPISGPCLLKVAIKTPRPLETVGPLGFDPVREDRLSLEFPVVQMQSVFDSVESTIRPVCDQAHQIFGEEGSPCFNVDGSWHQPGT